MELSSLISCGVVDLVDASLFGSEGFDGDVFQSFAVVLGLALAFVFRQGLLFRVDVKAL